MLEELGEDLKGFWEDYQQYRRDGKWMAWACMLWGHPKTWQDKLDGVRRVLVCRRCGMTKGSSFSQDTLDPAVKAMRERAAGR